MRNAYLQMCDFGSRFRILKGGKISLVVSALVLSGVLHVVQAATITTATAAKVTLANDENLSITNTGSITIPNAAVAVENTSLSNGVIVNNGTVSVTRSGMVWAFLLGDLTNADITNNGNIIVSSADLGVGINISNFTGSSIVNGEGASIIVNATGGIGATSMGINFNNPGTGSIQNMGTITATVNGVADKNGFALYTYVGIFGDNTTTGVLNGNIHVEDSFANNGKINLPYNATNAQIATFTNNSTGTLQIGLFTDGTTTTFSKLTGTTMTFASGSTIDVNVLGASTHVDLLADTTLENVVSASNSLTAPATLTVTDNSALVNFEYVKDGNTIDLNVVEATTILGSTISGGGKSNAQNAAGTLMGIKDGGNTGLNSFFTALNGLGTDASVAQAVTSTTPITGVSNVGANTQILNGIQGIVEQRQGVNIGGGLNSGDEVFAEKNFWFKPYGSWGTQDGKDGINGFDLKSRGAGLGFDGEYDKDSKLGFAFFYTDANVEVTGMPQESDLDVYTALVYGSIPVIDDKTKFLYQAGYSWQKTDAKRYISLLNETAKADYTSKTASLDVKLMRDYKINNELTLQPMLEATYRNFKSPSYTESGATTNLSVDSFKAEELVVGIGALAHYKLDDVSKIVANVNVGYDMMNDDHAITSAYAVAPTLKFITNGIDNGRWNYGAGIGYETQLSKESVINLMYNYEAQGSSFDNHSISARVQYKF